MIRSFRNKALRLFARKGDASKLPVQNDARVRRILATLDAASRPEDMDIPGYKFHALAGNPKRYSIWVSGNYRITFGFDGQDAVDVDIEDYH